MGCPSELGEPLDVGLDDDPGVGYTSEPGEVGAGAGLDTTPPAGAGLDAPPPVGAGLDTPIAPGEGCCIDHPSPGDTLLFDDPPPPPTGLMSLSDTIKLLKSQHCPK